MLFLIRRSIPLSLVMNIMVRINIIKWGVYVITLVSTETLRDYLTSPIPWPQRSSGRRFDRRGTGSLSPEVPVVGLYWACITQCWSSPIFNILKPGLFRASLWSGASDSAMHDCICYGLPSGHVTEPFQLSFFHSAQEVFVGPNMLCNLFSYDFITYVVFVWYPEKSAVAYHF